jgi:hypothetical protein
MSRLQLENWICRFTMAVLARLLFSSLQLNRASGFSVTALWSIL